ncbi:MAG: hypothetical protein SCJ97_00865 [Bacillota bacterium]|nr:hypothetical protein [Bacillota bacterium]
MKKMVNCTNWKEYQSLNGWVMFCSAGAYGRKLTVEEARSCGCTELQRQKCKKLMENNVGFGLVPEVNEESFVLEKHTHLEPILTRKH